MLLLFHYEPFPSLFCSRTHVPVSSRLFLPFPNPKIIAFASVSLHDYPVFDLRDHALGRQGKSVSGRKHISKWDLKDLPQMLSEDVHNNVGHVKAGKNVHSKELQPGRRSSVIACNDDPEFYGAETKKENGGKVSDVTMAGDGDVSYGTKMSPGLDEWRQQKQDRSPSSCLGRSYRSRSSSPKRRFKRKSGSHDSCNMTQPCNDQYVYHSAASDCIGEGSANGVFSKREYDRRNSVASFELNRNQDPRGIKDVPCKFFTAGYCRNGKYCRFSHLCQTSGSPNDKSWAHSIDNDRTLNCSKREYLQLKVAFAIDVSESRGPENWPGDLEVSHAWNHKFPSSDHIIKEEPARVYQISKLQFPEEFDIPCFQKDITREASIQHYTTEAIHPLISPNSCLQQEPSLQGDAANGLFSKDMKTRSDAISPSNLDYQNGQSSRVVTKPLQVLNPVREGVHKFMPYAQRRESITNVESEQVFTEDKYSKLEVEDTNRSELKSEVLSSQNMVTREQISQLTNLSASLAQLFGNGKQLPQLYAALDDFKPMGCMSLPLSSQPIELQKQYDPLTDAIEVTKPAISNLLQGLAPNSVVDEKYDLPLQNLFPSSVNSGPGDFDPVRTCTSDIKLDDRSSDLNVLDQVVNCKVPQNDKNVAEESKKGDDCEKVKKTSEGTVNRVFKFALVEFVKELLKPMWKDGLISKEAHKFIVKKVVDKVTGSIQGVHIPQSQEKIDNYLASSKPKLSKLVQAYLAKHHESKV